MKHTSLSFDGFGINSASAEFCPRLATFVRGNEADNAPLDEAERQRLGKLFASAPELLAALKTITEHCRLTIAEYRRFANEHGKDAIHPLDDAVLAKARAAIARATEGVAS